MVKRSTLKAIGKVMLSSPIEWGMVAAVALLVFGPKKFPELGRALGQGIGNFKKALNEAQDQVSAGIEDVEKDVKGKAGNKNAEKADSSGVPRCHPADSPCCDEEPSHAKDHPHKAGSVDSA